MSAIANMSILELEDYMESKLKATEAEHMAIEAKRTAIEAEHMAIEAAYNASKKAVEEAKAAFEALKNFMPKDVCATAQAHSPVGGWWSGKFLRPLPCDTPAVVPPEVKVSDTPAVVPPEVKVSDTPAVVPPEVKVSDTPEEDGWVRKVRVIKPKVIKPPVVTNFTVVFSSSLMNEVGKLPTTPEEAKQMCVKVLKSDFGREVNINIEDVVRSATCDGWTVKFIMYEQDRQTYPFDVKNRKMEWYLPCGRTFSEWKTYN
jgi:hypothetical protein